MEDWKVITIVTVVGLLSALVAGVAVFSFINASRTPSYPSNYYAPYQPPIVNSTPPPSSGNDSGNQNPYPYPAYPNAPTYPNQPTYPQQPGYQPYNPPSNYPPYNGYPNGGYGYGYGGGWWPFGGMM